MKRFFLRLFTKKQKPRLYPVVDEKNIIYKEAKDCVVLVLLILLVAASCSPTASLPNGCRYKLHAPKFTK
jgi:hypothetical protein